MKKNNQKRDKVYNKESSNKKEGEYFYFDLADKSHEKLAIKDKKEGAEAPLENLEGITDVEY